MPEDVIIGFEQEFAISFTPEDGTSLPELTYRTVLKQATECLIDHRVLDYENSMGGRIYIDHPLRVSQELRRGFYHHLEAATPECRGAREAALYSRAADAEILGRFLRVCQNPKRFSLPQGSYHLLKASTDWRGNWWGLHRNFRIPQRIPNEFLLSYLGPFLVTKVVWAGQGGIAPRLYGPKNLDSWPNSDKEIIFTLSPRALAIQGTISSETTVRRPLICTGRFSDYKSYDLPQWKRLQLIEGDPLLSDTITYVEAGMTSLVLRLLANNCFPRCFPRFETYQYREILNDFHILACDPTLKTPIHFASAITLTALEVQRRYLELIWENADKLSLTAEDQDVLYRFEEILRLLGQDPTLLAGVSECWFKYLLFEKKLAQYNTSWDACHEVRIEHHGKQISLSEYLLMLHHQLTALDDWGIWPQLVRSGRVETLFSDEEVAEARKHPPATRAAWRVEVLRQARRNRLLAPLGHSWSHIILMSFDPAAVNNDPTGRSNTQALRRAEELIKKILKERLIV